MYDVLVERLRAQAEAERFYTGEEMLYSQATDAIETLIKRVTAVEAERNAAMKRLCEWCGVGCSMENRRAELCEIAAVGLEFLANDCTSPDWATCQPEPPKEEK